MVRSRRARGQFDNEEEKGIHLYESPPGTEKSLWEHYNELTAKLDATQAIVWNNMADTTLIFSGLFAAVLSIYIGFVLNQLKPDTGVVILNQISNKLRNNSDPVPGSSDDAPDTNLPHAMQLLTLSLNWFLAISVLALLLKHWLWFHAPMSRAHLTPKDQAKKRELIARSYWRSNLLVAFGCLPFLMQIGVYFFFLGCAFTMKSFGSKGDGALGFHMSGTNGQISFIVSIAISTLVTLGPLIWNGRYAFLAGRILMARAFDATPDDETVYVGISNCLFTHTSMDPKNFPIFIQLFSLPVMSPRIRFTSLAPWIQLSSLLPSMLMEIYSKSRYNLLPALRLCLVVSGQGQSEQLQVNREAKTVYSTIETIDPLQNLYLNLLLSRFHATAGDTDHWQEACRILKCLEYSKEHTSELVWLVDYIQLYTLWIEEDFTTRIVEFLGGVVVYLAKCHGDEHDVGLLRTATIMTADWLMTRETSDNGNLLSSRDVHPGKGNQEMFVVKDQEFPPYERLQHTVKVFERSHSSSDFAIIHTLIIPILAIEVFEAEINGWSTSSVAFRIQISDLWCALEGLWSLWEGGLNQSHLLHFVWELVPLPSPPVEGTQSSLVTFLLKQYLQQIKQSSALITERAFRFIDAALEYSLTTGTTRDELDIQLQDVQWPNPWVSLHIDSILRRRSTLQLADLEAVVTLDPGVKAIVSKERLNLYLSSNIQPEPEILTQLVQSEDIAISLEAFGQGVNLLQSPLIGESPFTFTKLDPKKRFHLITSFFDPQQSTSTYQSVWIMLTEDLYPRWKLLPVNWRSDIAAALVAATDWMVKGQEILVQEVKKPKARQLIGATVLALVNYSDIEHRRKRKIPLEARDGRFQERLDACARVYLQLFATAVEDLGGRAKPHTQHIVNFLVDIPDALYDEGAIKRIRRILEI